MRRTLSIAIVFIAALSATQSTAADDAKAKKPAAAKPAGGKLTVMGKVSTTKVDTDKFTTIKLKAQDGTVYNITIDEKGKEVAKSYEGISVQVTGSESTKAGEKWLTVEQIGSKKVRKK